MRGRSSSRLSTVDSTPTGQAPPSITNSTLSPRSAITWSALVGDSRPEGLALGAASGRPAIISKVCAILCAGTRIATLSNPAVASREILQSRRRGSTSVSGPGQKARATVCAFGDSSAYCAALAMFATCTIRGLKLGRPLAAKIAATARSLVASPPRP